MFGRRSAPATVAPPCKVQTAPCAEWYLLPVGGDYWKPYGNGAILFYRNFTNFLENIWSEYAEIYGNIVKHF